MKQGTVSEMMGFGNSVSIFDLCELMGKSMPMNYLTLKLIDNLKPDDFDLFDDEELEFEHLKFA